MEYLDILIKLAGGITALVLLWKSMKAIVNFSNVLNDLKKHDEEQYLAILRLTIMNESMPIGERISSGIEYLKRGGNGEVKKFLKEKFNINETVDTASHYVEKKKS
jgi:hypothetical protein